MAFITLHIGLGTFRPVDVEDLTKHKMDSENFIVGDEAVDIVNNALDNKNRVCAIGTTTMRALESAVSANNRLKAREGWTDKFIFPPYDFKICNAMITNFHMPESTLLMMASAFAGYDLAMEAYKVRKRKIQVPYLWRRDADRLALQILSLIMKESIHEPSNCESIGRYYSCFVR